MGEWFSRVRGMRSRGYFGPKYRGIAGQFRLLCQGWFGHEEIVSFAEASWWKRPSDTNPNVTLLMVETFDQVVPHLSQLQAAYRRDLAEEWKAFFGWGQTVALAFLNGRLAGFAWIQDGSKGAATPYVPLLPDEYRLVRVGVLPVFRGLQVQSTCLVLVLEWLFTRGARRVYIDAFVDNVYAWKGQHNAGFRELGRIRVGPAVLGKADVQWLRLSAPESRDGESASDVAPGLGTRRP